jgi:serine/threonine protein kinase
MSDETGHKPYSVLQDRYRIESIVGKGGMASVYRAHDELLGRDVAIKLFEATPSDAEELARQHHELAVLASLNHPSLVTLHDAGVDRTDPRNPRRFLVMELVQRDPLLGARSPNWPTTSPRDSNTCTITASFTAT